MFNVYSFEDIAGITYHVGHTATNGYHVECELIITSDDNGLISVQYDNTHNCYSVWVDSNCYSDERIDTYFAELINAAMDNGESGRMVCAMLDMLKVIARYE